MADKQLEAGPKPPVSLVNSRDDNDMQKFDPTKDTWNEERLEKAIKTLKEMHIQLRSLRTTIPRLLAPLATQHPAPHILFQEFTKSINTANYEVQEFRQLMTDEESRQIFEHAKKFRAENRSRIRPWNVTEHPDWLTKDA